MGPIGSPLSKIGVQVTDSNYVLLSMRVMTRVSPEVWRHLRHEEEFVKCLHSIGKQDSFSIAQVHVIFIRSKSGVPRPHSQKIVNNWPCNPEKTIVSLFNSFVSMRPVFAKAGVNGHVRILFLSRSLTFLTYAK